MTVVLHCDMRGAGSLYLCSDCWTRTAKVRMRVKAPVRSRVRLLPPVDQRATA